MKDKPRAINSSNSIYQDQKQLTSKTSPDFKKSKLKIKIESEKLND